MPLAVESLRNHFKEICLTVCYDEKIVGPDGTASHTHEEADTLIPNQVNIYIIMILNTYMVTHL